MDVIQFTRMLSDKDFPNLKKLKYKYPGDFAVFVETLKTLYYKKLPIKAADGTPLVYMDNYVNVDLRSVKLLLRQQRESYGVKAVEDEILASSAIESIDFDRDSVRSILRGFAPKDETENRILGQKKGVEFISNPGNTITEENLHALYQMMVGDFLPAEERLPDGAYYRINELLKAAMIHFYIAYLHPYFNGNGRMARMVHLWYLIQRGYQTTLFVPFSSLIAKSRREYYSAFTVVEENSKLSGVLDVTPFLQYFTKMVYDRMPQSAVNTDILTQYREAIEAGQVTEKESALWRFVLSHYGSNEFSTKQLERDFGNAAYATIRSFVLKFQSIGILESTAYGKRVKYRIKP